VREADVDTEAGAEPTLAQWGSVGLVGEPRRRDELADQDAEDREDDRPGDPVAEGRDRPDHGGVLPPALVGEERDPARLLGEHGGELGVDDVEENRQEGREGPEDHGAPTAEIEDRVTQRTEQEARVGQGDHESVVPAKGLEEFLLLNDCFGHVSPPCVLVA
jgi:hypothetical protein